MSVTVDYFLNYGAGMPELARELNDVIGCSLTLPAGEPREEPSEVYFSVFLAMGLWLGRREFENDGECTYEDYEYHLSTRTRAGDADFRDAQIPATALIAYALYRRRSLAGMLVYDGQILLAKYAERLNPQTNEPDLYDEVSGEFVVFPAHVNALESRFPEDDI